MDINDLIKKRSASINRISSLEKSISSVSSRSGLVPGRSGMTVEFYTGNSSCRSEINIELILEVLEKELALAVKEAEPLNKKYEAINLMLNS